VHDHLDEPLVDRARRGDERAWEDLYRAVAPRLRRYLARRVAADHHRRADRQRREVAAGCRVAAPVTGDGDPGEAVELAHDRHAVRPPSPPWHRPSASCSGRAADDGGTALGKRPGAVRTAQSRAVARLRRLVDQSGAGRPRRRSHGHGPAGRRPDHQDRRGG
jgi:DNA-directed RNA polymerase specialized sigma24 family protein